MGGNHHALIVQETVEYVERLFKQTGFIQWNKMLDYMNGNVFGESIARFSIISTK